jgi:hypothetical protein
VQKQVVAAAILGLLFTAPAALADNKSDLADAVYDYNKCYWAQDMVMKLMNFKLSPGIWTKMLEKDGWGISTTSNAARNMEEFAKKNGWGDLEEAESANNNDRANNKAHVLEMVDTLKPKIGFTLQADLKGSNAEWDLVHRYMTTVTEFLANGDWKPRAKTPFITLVVTSAVKDVVVTVTPDGKNFTVSCPSNHETEEWDGKITKGLQKAGR